MPFSSCDEPEPLGVSGERQAKDYLLGRGYGIVATNWRYTRVAEVDIIATAPQQNRLVFLEVKTRRRHMETAIQGLTAAKRRRLVQAMQRFVQQHPQWAQYDLQVDWLLVYPPPPTALPGTAWLIRHYPNVLQLDEPW